VSWSGVRERVIALAEAENRARGYGPLRYPVFEPALTLAEIAEVEAQLGVGLPGEYRTFLAEVGAGGPGPAHRLTSLRRIRGSWGWVSDDDEEYPWRADTSRPFTETRDWLDRQRATLRAAGYEPTTRDPEDDYLADYRRAFGNEDAWYEDRGRGAVHISDNGCAMTGWLVLVGPHRGELRHRDDGPNPPFRRYVDARGTPHTFRTWYLTWLERRENETSAG
jgi:hypothetical protein